MIVLPFLRMSLTLCGGPMLYNKNIISDSKRVDPIYVHLAD